jgi:D-alanyl-D-alanine carboxypeptidase/D-alanyl-D-alanine-endopeptidase (penicillin-binding protein 4)
MAPGARARLNFNRGCVGASSFLHSGMIHLTRLSIIWLLFSLPFILSAQSLQKEALQHLIDAPSIRNAHVGISVYDPETGKYIYQYQSDHFFTPASNTKIPSCYLAMKYLGDSLLSFRIKEVGDSIYLSPAADPTFLNPQFSYQPVFERLRATNKTIFLQYNSKDSFTPFGSGWTWDGYQDSYCSERAAMPIFGNLVHFRRSGRSLVVHPKMVARPPYMNELMIQLLGKGEEFEIDRQYDKNVFFVRKRSSAFSGQEVPFKTDNGVTNFLFLRDTLNRTENNFFLGMDRDFSDYRPLYSQRTDLMLRVMMYDSDNHLADQSLLMVSQKRLGKIDDDALIKLVMSTDFAQMPHEPRWTDGSGLSRYNLFSPDDFVFILDRMKKEFGMERISKILPTGGTGTMKSYYNSIPNKIYAKTGTLSGVVALSGFIQAQSGKWLIFSVLVNNHRTSATVVRQGIEQFILKVRALN